ncbi:MAG: tRNA threonylcarbamoyladenosine dehydratase [Ruminococcus sp.]|nr:tRNA threonylcarbamoyladenosine dehydratase [Ruminococcus sp.]
MKEQYSRLQRLIGLSALERLSSARVAVFGVGGVGGYVVEALARSGVGALDIFDNDTVALSNLNRQIIALHSTVGRLKVDVCEERIHDIDPECKVTKHAMFVLPENIGEIDFREFDYVVDAIDTVSGKIAIIEQCNALGVPIISSMGTGNKLDPFALKITDIYKTSGCPLARVMRRELKKRNIKSLKVLCSSELPLPCAENSAEENAPHRRSVPGSTAFVPPAAGLMIASQIVREIAGI